MCRRWRDSYEAFLEDMGRRPSPEHSLDRIDNNGGYEPENCRWATDKEQNNNSRNARGITIKGVTKPLQQWLEETGTSRSTFYRLLRLGATEARALGLQDSSS